MSRGLSDNQNTYIAGDSLISFTLIHISVYGGSDLYYTDGPYDLDYNGQTYEAQGQFLGISEMSEAADLSITSINIIISALDLTSVQTLGTANQINQDVEIYRVFIDPTDNSLIGDSAGDQALLLFKGKIAGYRIEDAEETAQMIIEVNSQFTNFERKAGRRTNLGSFQKEHPQDFGMQYSFEPLLDIKWGKK